METQRTSLFGGSDLKTKYQDLIQQPQAGFVEPEAADEDDNDTTSASNEAVSKHNPNSGLPFELLLDVVSISMEDAKSQLLGDGLPRTVDEIQVFFRQLLNLSPHETYSRKDGDSFYDLPFAQLLKVHRHAAYHAKVRQLASISTECASKLWWILMDHGENTWCVIDDVELEMEENMAKFDETLLKYSNATAGQDAERHWWLELERLKLEMKLLASRISLVNVAREVVQLSLDFVEGLLWGKPPVRERVSSSDISENSS